MAGLLRAKTFLTKHEAKDWRGAPKTKWYAALFIQRASSEKTTAADALDRYKREIVPAKKAKFYLHL
ncbi:MAG: hypothetical protein VB142_10110 [Burkholderia sp.]